MVDLKGGLTGQVLAKATNADMDFSWVTTDDANAIQNAIVDAKGDLIAASAADTPARLAVGNNGETLVADSSTSTGLRYQGNFAAGKNLFINGDLGINQRAFTSNTTSSTFNFDRWSQLQTGGGTLTTTPQVLAPATISGYGGVNYVRCVTASQSAVSDYAIYRYQGIEDVRLSAGQTVTISFYAKAASGTPKIGVETDQGFGSGGSAGVTTAIGTVTLSTSWARYSVTGTIPSVSGKTIGAGNCTTVYLWLSAGSNFNSRTGSIGNQNNTFEMTGFQYEISNTATSFQTSTGTLQGELAAAQRYYYRQTIPTAAFAGMCAAGWVFSTTRATFAYHLPVPMRVAPTALDQANIAANRATTDTRYSSGTWALGGTNGTNNQVVEVFYTHGSAVFTQGDLVFIQTNNASNQFIGFSAEL
jgi:hypothetical protein